MIPTTYRGNATIDGEIIDAVLRLDDGHLQLSTRNNAEILRWPLGALEVEAIGDGEYRLGREDDGFEFAPLYDDGLGVEIALRNRFAIPAHTPTMAPVSPSESAEKAAAEKPRRRWSTPVGHRGAGHPPRHAAEPSPAAPQAPSSATGVSESLADRIVGKSRQPRRRKGVLSGGDLSMRAALATLGILALVIVTAALLSRSPGPQTVTVGADGDTPPATLAFTDGEPADEGSVGVPGSPTDDSDPDTTPAPAGVEGSEAADPTSGDDDPADGNATDTDQPDTAPVPPPAPTTTAPPATTPATTPPSTAPTTTPPPTTTTVPPVALIPVFEVDPDQARARWDALAERTDPILVSSGFSRTEDGFRFAAGSYVDIVGTVGPDGTVESLSFNGDPTGSVLDDRRVLAALGMTVSLFEPDLPPEGRRQFVEALGLDITDPFLGDLDEDMVYRGHFYRLYWDVTTLNLVLTGHETEPEPEALVDSLLGTP